MALYIAHQPPVNDDAACLAPGFARGVASAVAACNAAGWDAMVHETCRSAELQQWYFDHGASKARTIESSWHGYALAVDVVSRQHGWDLWGRSQPTAWQSNVVRLFKAEGLAWGGEWITFKDWPHFQWGRCAPSPGPLSRAALAAGRLGDVWNAVGAA